MPGSFIKRREVRLEGSCETARAGAHIRVGPSSGGIECLEARFLGRAFAPHRHDTYAVGITLSGVQTFRYRGTMRYCLPGQCHVLHPDELHDGAAGSDAGFAYRIAYVDPALIQQALGGAPLPFVADPVFDLTGPQRVLLRPTWEMQNPLDELGQVDSRRCLRRHAGGGFGHRTPSWDATSPGAVGRPGANRRRSGILAVSRCAGASVRP